MSDDKNGFWDTEEDLLTTQAPCVPHELLCYIAKLEEYIKFLTDTGNKTAMYLAIHGMGDSQEDIENGARLREELYQLRKAI